jgi:peptidoglycan-associated lipoprotein
MTRLIRLFAVAATLVFLAGCAAQQPEPSSAPPAEEQPEQMDEQMAEPSQPAEPAPGASTAAAADCPPTCDFARNAIDQADSVLSDRTIYFEFDSSEVQDKFMEVIERHAAYLSQYPDVQVRLEGHTDERGSREYNIGLGARRASSVAELLQVHGVSSDQIDTVSYGEEKPAVMGHNEEAWSQNRRVELVYSR